MQRDQAHRTNELLERIAVALEKSNKKETPKDIPLTVTNDIPGFEGTLDKLDDLCNVRKDNTLSDKCLAANCDGDECTHNDDIHNDYLNDLVKEMSKEQYTKFYLDMDFGFALSDTVSFNNHIYDLEKDEVLDCIKSARNILDEYTYEHDEPGNEYSSLVEYHCGVVNDSDWNIRKTADSYQAALDCETHFTSKKECILDYVTNEFGILGARYTDIIKLAYYLGSPNAPKYTSANRGYYSQAFNVGRYNGHLAQGGKDCLVKGINKEGNERYFALSEVESFTDYWKRIA